MWKMQRDSGGLPDRGLFKCPPHMQHPENGENINDIETKKNNNKVTERRWQTQMMEVT